MSLTNLFNFSFLKENIKRSKSVILLLVFLIPVINVIIYLMSASSSTTFIPTIYELGPLSILGMYIMPVILSITLFSFIYKRKSSDFVMSFPVSKKQIFLSNTLGGIIIIIVMNLVNYLFTLIATLLLDNVILDYQMLFDLFILWTVAYIFVFTSTSIAVSLSSNKITTVVVTLLVLFLVPFTHTFITSDTFKGTSNSDISTYCDNEACTPQNYKCYGTSCEINKRNNIYTSTYYYEIEDTTNYTLPYALIIEELLGGTTTKVNSSILKMFFLSIAYIVIGLVLFTRKKFEVVETSFKSERLHIFVRSLTTIPILCVYYIILKNTSLSTSDFFTLIFLVVLLITYVIIYDLLTRKKVTNILKSLSALMIVAIIVLFTGEISSKEIEYIAVDDITRMTIEKDNLATFGGYTTNKDLINYVMSIHMDNMSISDYTDTFNIQIKVDKKTYEFRISVNNEQYNYIINTLINDETYKKTSEKVKEKDIFAIKLNGNSSYIDKDSELYTKIIEEFRNNESMQTEYNSPLFTSIINIYSDYETKEILFYIDENSSLAETILNYYNEETIKAFKNPDINIFAYYIGKYDKENITVSEDYISSYNDDYTKIINFILDNSTEKVDITKPYMYIKMYASDNYHNYSYLFLTNKVEELEGIVREVKEIEEANTGDTDDKYTY